MHHFNFLVILISFLGSVNSYYTSDYDENTPRQFIEKLNDQDFNEDEPEPINPFTSSSTNYTVKPLDYKNMLCEDFEEYATNCTTQAKKLYDSTGWLPLPTELKNWCAALKSITTCEYDWNKDCKDVTEKTFNELAIKGQLHVLDKVCQDDWFAARYDKTMSKCINAVSKEWKACYMGLKRQTGGLTNATTNWVHYETHFFLCCARTRFRRCTLEALLKFTRMCSPEQAVLLQKFSSIISEGEVFQDCNFNMVFASCPDGDPRPPTYMVSRLMGEDDNGSHQVSAFPIMVGSFAVMSLN